MAVRRHAEAYRGNPSRDALVRGYLRVSSLPAGLLAARPTFLMAQRLCTLGRLFSRSERAHAAAQRKRRLITTPAAVRSVVARSTKQLRLHRSLMILRLPKSAGGV